MSEIISETPLTPSDYFSGDFCECFHLINEEHFNGKCYGLDCMGGVIWKACNCRKVNPIQYEIMSDGNSIQTSDSNNENQVAAIAQS